jgi:SHS2 domain-containing protein
MGGFTEIDHTADYALRVWGIDLGDLIASAGQGLIALLLGDAMAPVAEWVEYEVEAPDEAALLLRALREVLYQVEEGRVPVAFEVLAATAEPARARCRVGLTAPGEGQGLVQRAIKAVTYHDLAIRPEGDWLTVTLTLDT